MDDCGDSGGDGVVDRSDGSRAVYASDHYVNGSGVRNLEVMMLVVIW